MGGEGTCGLTDGSCPEPVGKRSSKVLIIDDPFTPSPKQAEAARDWLDRQERTKERKKQFNAREWAWLMKDENCRNVIAGERDTRAALFYCNFRLPRSLRNAFWQD